MKRLLFAFGLCLLSFSAQAAVCPVTNPLAKDATASPQTFNVPYADDGSGSGACEPKVFANGQAVNATAATWTSGTAANTNVDLTNSGNYPSVLVTIDYGTTSAGAVTFRGKKANGSYETMPVAQVLNKSTCASLTNAFSLLTGGQTGASAQDFLLLTNGYSTINADLTSQATGLSGNLVVTYTLLPYNAVLNCLPNPAATNVTTLGTTNSVAANAYTAGGWTPKWFIAANTDNATNLKASPGVVHAVQVFGVGSAPAYLKFYDKASSPTCNSDTIVKQIMIPAASTAANGSGAIGTVIDTQFSTGISYCVVTGIAANDDTSPAATTFVINIDWK